MKSSALTLKPEKCRFAYEEHVFLSHVTSKSGVLPDSQKAAAVANIPLPIYKKAVRRLLGLCAYYRALCQKLPPHRCASGSCHEIRLEFKEDFASRGM